MTNHSSILAVRIQWTVWKGKRLWHWKMNPPGWKVWHWKMSPPRVEGIQYANREEQRATTNSSRKNKVVGSKQKWHSVMDVSGGESKVRCCQEQYYIGTWNVRSMNQSKVDMVKQEMERVNILGINELKWMGMGEFNSDDHYINYCGQYSLRRNGVALKVNKTVWNAVRGYNLKNDRMISVGFQGKPFNNRVIQIYAPTTDVKEAETEWFYEYLQELELELTHTHTKDVLFIIGDWNAKLGNQEIPEVTGEFGLGVQNEVRQRITRVLPREHAGYSKHNFSTTQETTLHMDITIWSI